MSHWHTWNGDIQDILIAKNDLDGFNTESLEISKNAPTEKPKWKTLTQDNILNSEPFYGGNEIHHKGTTE